MGRIMVDKYTVKDVIDWYNAGIEVSYRMKDGNSLFFKTTIAKLKTKVKKTKDKEFVLGDGPEKTFEEYSDVLIDTSNKRHIKVGTKDNKFRKEQIVSHKEFHAYAQEFGISNLKLKSEINIKEVEIDTIIDSEKTKD